MTTSVVVIFEAKIAENVQTTQYVSVGVKTIIDKFTADNTTGGSLTFAVNLVPSGGTAGASNLMFTRTLLPGQSYTCPEVAGHVLEAGDFISTIAGGAGVTIRASGRQISP